MFHETLLIHTYACVVLFVSSCDEWCLSAKEGILAPSGGLAASEGVGAPLCQMRRYRGWEGAAKSITFRLASRQLLEGSKRTLKKACANG